MSDWHSSLTGSTEDFYRRSWIDNTTTTHSIPSPTAAKSGALRNPGELGRQEPAIAKEDPLTSPRSRNIVTNPAALRRKAWTKQLIAAAHTPSAIAAQTKTIRKLAAWTEAEPSCVNSLCYRGMEVIFATTNQPTACYGMCARTRLVFQTLDVPASARVLALVSHPVTGQVVVGTDDGELYTYWPQPVDTKVHCFGKYRWINAAKISTSKVFYPNATKSRYRTTANAKPGQRLDVSVDYNGKILVGHRNQLAVYDRDGTLLWTTSLEAPLLTAKLSGDGLSIACVVEAKDSDGDNDYGVQIFERDTDDGSNVLDASPMPAKLESNVSVGILYKRGPFLVHSSTVTRVAFRGFGNVTSSPTTEEPQANDLLLTHCDEDGSARIYGQNGWKPLTDWVTPPRTRIDWVRGISAFTLGDLESQKKPVSRANGPGSLSSLARDTEDNTGGLHRHFQSLPSHTTPLTNAGAWITEITFQGTFPALRLSRLTYLKRGVDDINPTLFESVSAFLPPGSLLPDTIVDSDEAGLNVCGIWPAWNPWLSESSDFDSNEPMRGSAMSLLGLSSGIATGFGDQLLGGTQTPPNELRIVASHPLSGKAVVLELSLFTDKSLSSLELGSPQKSLLSLSDVKYPRDILSSEHHEAPRISSSRDFFPGNLVATAYKNSIQFSWHRQGTLSLLPFHWLPDDCESDKAIQMLSGCKRLRDESLLPVPLALPSVQMPGSVEDELICNLMWWPGNHTDGPPLLVAINNAGTIIVIQIPPPWSELEPPMPGMDDFSSPAVHADTQERREAFEEEYEVDVIPDPEYGLGLRLESQADGLPAVVGSFKRNPLTGDILPAEETGMIMLGDELLSANDVCFDNKNFDYIIAAVRDLGSKCGPRESVRLRFKRRGKLSRTNSYASESSNRRTMEQILGVRPEKPPPGVKLPSSGNSTTITNEATKPVDLDLDSEAMVVCVFSKILPDNLFDGGRREDIAVLLPYLSNREPSNGGTRCLLFSLNGTDIEVHSLEIFPDLEEDNGCAVYMGRSRISELRLCSLSNVKFAQNESFAFFICDDYGSVFFLRIDVFASSQMSDEPKLDFTCEKVFSVDSANITLRTYSVQLLATMQKDESGSASCQVIKVWSARPHPGFSLSSSSETSPISEFYCEDIRVEVMPSLSSTPNRFVDFLFVDSGRLDVSPLLVTFSLDSVVVYQRLGGRSEWIATLHVSFSSIFHSTNNLSDGMRSVPLDCNPTEVFPHLLSAVSSTYSSTDEAMYLRSDWHAESLLANICLDDHGVSSALKNRIRYLYLWLCSEGSDIPEDYLEGPLIVAPLSVLEENDDNFTDTKVARNDLMTITSPDANHSDCLKYKDAEALRSLQQVVEERLVIMDVAPRDNNEGIARANGVVEFPPVLNAMAREDLHILWAIGQMVLNPPELKNLDNCGQLFVFASELLNNIEQVKYAESASKRILMPLMMQRRSSSHKVETTVKDVNVASAACLAALLSSDQASLIEVCRRKASRIDWDFWRPLRVPFWLRSDVELARLSEEIGQSIFREKRDIMECALFFIIARKMRTLRNLAATDRSESGSKFFKFVTSYDFSTDRGRKAAEKNAFSLLRKNRYGVASAFFLLAQPPSIKAALETIVTKMQDIDLAFLVARLCESSELGSQSIASGNNLNSIMGGGGGYASQGTSTNDFIPKDPTPFPIWTPSLCSSARKLLVERGLPSTSSDNCMTSVQLIWLNKLEESTWWLAGFIQKSPSADTGYRVRDDFNRFDFDRRRAGTSNQDSRQLLFKTMNRANELIDFLSAPSLLRSMGAGARVQQATSFLVSEALAARGVEIAAMRSIMNKVDDDGKSDIQVNERKSPSSMYYPRKSSPANAESISHTTMPQSSIFESFDVPAQEKSKGNIATSIAASFDPSVRLAPPSSKVDPNPSIVRSPKFDSFDSPVTRTKTSSHSEDVASSIFDAFDLPPTVTKPAQRTDAPSSGDMNSSIFDSYQAPVASGQPTQILSHGEGYRIDKKVETCSEESTESVPELMLCIPRVDPPRLWLDWGTSTLLVSASRRLLREIASLLAQYRGDPAEAFYDESNSYDKSIIPTGATEVLQLPCDSQLLVRRVRQSLRELSSATGLETNVIISNASEIIGQSGQHRRILFTVFLYLAGNDDNMAEYTVQTAASRLIYFCNSFAFGNDRMFLHRKSRAYVAGQYMRKVAARLSWELEVCLWIHRGGGLPLSGDVLKESILAVRVGFLLSSWNRNFECIEAMIRSEPDCHTDEEAGRHLWTSVKIISRGDEKSRTATSGGWEFLVDCRRSEATSMLRERPTGCFIIRPHSNDTGVFTLSFKTNLIPDGQSGQEIDEGKSPDTSGDELGDSKTRKTPRQMGNKSMKKEDIVQHAVIRLSDSGFRCGSFGPFASLLSLLEAVSASLPFRLRFDMPPTNRVIKEEGSQTSPNAVFLRRLALSNADSLASSPPFDPMSKRQMEDAKMTLASSAESPDVEQSTPLTKMKLKCFGLFLELLILSRLRKQFSSVAAVDYDDDARSISEPDDEESQGTSSDFERANFEGRYTNAFRILSPFINWCKLFETEITAELAPDLAEMGKVDYTLSTKTTEQSNSIEVSHNSNAGDSILRKLIQPDSGVDFSTLKLTEGGECTLVVLFSKIDALHWLVKNQLEKNEIDAENRLKLMERKRVIEPVDLNRLHLKHKQSGMNEGLHYRFIDPWEVEAVSDRDGETKGATLGRERFLSFSLGKVALSSEIYFRTLGGLPSLELWTSIKGGVVLTKALATVNPPWERGSGGDLEVRDGTITEPPLYLNSIRQHLYRNALFRRLGLPQRYVALMQVELLDLKNLNSPGGSVSLHVYAILRLRRSGSSAELNNKSRTLDTATTQPMKLGKASGPNAPASWGSVVRFRFPLPEDVSIKGTSIDADREVLFKGPPSVLQMSVYERKLLVDHSLGSADVRTDGLSTGNQLEEWVPLRSEKHGISWFARIRLTLRFELMCHATDVESPDISTAAPSVGLSRIEQLSRAGGSTHENLQRRSMSSPDLLAYFESWT